MISKICKFLAFSLEFQKKIFDHSRSEQFWKQNTVSVQSSFVFFFIKLSKNWILDVWLMIQLVHPVLHQEKCPSFLPLVLIMAENVGKHFELMDEVIEVAGFSFPLHIFPLNLCLTASDKCIKAPSQCLLDGFSQEPMI